MAVSRSASRATIRRPHPPYRTLRERETYVEHTCRRDVSERSPAAHISARSWPQDRRGGHQLLGRVHEQNPMKLAREERRPRACDRQCSGSTGTSSQARFGLSHDRLARGRLQGRRAAASGLLPGSVDNHAKCRVPPQSTNSQPTPGIALIHAARPAMLCACTRHTPWTRHEGTSLFATADR